MSKDGWLPPGVTDADIDRAHQGPKSNMSDVCREGRHEECQNCTAYGWASCECDCHEPRLWHCSACGTPNDHAEDWYCSGCHKLFDEDEDDWEG